MIIKHKNLPLVISLLQFMEKQFTIVELAGVAYEPLFIQLKKGEEPPKTDQVTVSMRYLQLVKIYQMEYHIPGNPKYKPYYIVYFRIDV